MRRVVVYVECDHCSQEFEEKEALNLEIRHPDGKVFEIDLCNACESLMLAEAREKVIKRRPGGSKPPGFKLEEFECTALLDADGTMCGKKFSSMKGLKRHKTQQGHGPEDTEE